MAANFDVASLTPEEIQLLLERRAKAASDPQEEEQRAYDEQQRAYNQNLDDTTPYAIERLMSFLKGERPMQGSMEQYIAARQGGMLPGGPRAGGPNGYDLLRQYLAEKLQPLNVGDWLTKARGMLDQAAPMYRTAATKGNNSY